MKCPLSLTVQGKQECLERGCAWWDIALGQCSIVSIAQKLRESVDEQERAANQLDMIGRNMQ